MSIHARLLPFYVSVGGKGRDKEQRNSSTPRMAYSHAKLGLDDEYTQAADALLCQYG
jgi:hypothetical protein